MTKQGELFAIRDTKTLDEKLQSMVSELEFRRSIPAPWFNERFGWSDRICRAVAAHSNGLILGMDSGYILNANATNEEFKEANGRIYSQAKKMLRRALRERRVRHMQIGGE